MQFIAHSSTKRRIDQLMLTDTRQSGKGLRHNARLIMISVTGKIGYLHRRIGKRCPDQRLDIGSGHRHRQAADMI